MSRTRAALSAAAVALLGAACAQPNLPVSSASGATEPPHGSPAAVVTLVHSSFGPSVVTIRPGETVEWVWDDGGIPHNVTFATFHSATITTGTYYHTFVSPGVYPYRSTLDATMVGTVIVR
jgi:plastocyanin